MDGSEGHPRFPIISPLLPVSFPDFDPSSFLVDEQSCTPNDISRNSSHGFSNAWSRTRNEKEWRARCQEAEIRPGVRWHHHWPVNGQLPPGGSWDTHGNAVCAPRHKSDTLGRGWPVTRLIRALRICTDRVRVVPNCFADFPSTPPSIPRSVRSARGHREDLFSLPFPPSRVSKSLTNSKSFSFFFLFLPN